MSASSIAVAFTVAFLAFAAAIRAQLADPAADAVRVTVSLNADGSRTVYEFDPLRSKATATTTGKDGKAMGRIRYVLDSAGRFASGEVYGPDDILRFRTSYKYNAAGQLEQETQLSKDDVVQHRLVYGYDAKGRQTGYKVYNAAGKLVSQTGGASAKATPTRKKPR